MELLMCTVWLIAALSVGLLCLALLTCVTREALRTKHDER